MSTRTDTKRTRRCVQCGKIVGKLTDAEEREFLLSKMCPKCFREAVSEVGVQPNLTVDNWATILSIVRREIRNRNAFGPEILKGRDVTELRIIEDTIINMAFERAKGGEDDKT